MNFPPASNPPKGDGPFAATLFAEVTTSFSWPTTLMSADHAHEGVEARLLPGKQGEARSLDARGLVGPLDLEAVSSPLHGFGLNHDFEVNV